MVWFLLQKEFTLRQFLEIGVYRGQTLSLVFLLQQIDRTDGVVAGTSPFCAAGDSVSRYREDIDYLDGARQTFRTFSLPEPGLLRASSIKFYLVCQDGPTGSRLQVAL